MNTFFRIRAGLFAVFCTAICPVAASAQPDYCTPPFLGTTYAGITNVTLNGTPAINRTSTWAELYKKAGETTTMVQGQEFTVQVTTENSLESIFGNTNTRVWIDWNQDYDFNDAGEQVASWNNHTLRVPQKKTFTVPANAVVGTTRMRVYCDMIESGGHDTPSPCGYEYSTAGIEHHGEVEDYNVEIIKGASTNSPPVLLSVSDSSATVGTPYTLTIKVQEYDPSDEVTFNVMAKPSWLTSSTNAYSGIFTLTLTGTPQASDAGVAVVRVGYADKNGSSGERTVNIKVTKINSAPAAPVLMEPTNNAAVDIDINSPIDFAWSAAVDPDNTDKITYELKLSGPGFDTTISDIDDTQASLAIRDRLKGNATYTWSVKAHDGQVASPNGGPFTFTTVTTAAGINNTEASRNGVTLGMNYPNPAAERTVIPYELSESTTVTVELYSVSGQLVRSIEQAAPRSAGRHSVTLDATTLPSGAYIVRLTTPHAVVARMIELAR